MCSFERVCLYYVSFLLEFKYRSESNFEDCHCDSFRRITWGMMGIIRTKFLVTDGNESDEWGAGDVKGAASNFLRFVD
jgi:hypothetical protein